MKIKLVDGEIARMWKRNLPKTLEYSGEVQQYESAAEIRQANDWPSDEDVLAYKNTARVNNARQKFMAERLADEAKVWAEANKGSSKANPYVQPTLENDEALRVKNIVDSLKAAGKSEAEALVIAKAALGISD